jgi:hypothetical protein
MPKKPASYGHLLRECADIADDREEHYGEIKKNYESISAFCRSMFGLELTPSQIVKVMIATKWARHLHHPKKDNLMDAVNYTAILAKFEEDEAYENTADIIAIESRKDEEMVTIPVYFPPLKPRAQKTPLQKRPPRKDARRNRAAQ